MRKVVLVGIICCMIGMSSFGQYSAKAIDSLKREYLQATRDSSRLQLTYNLALGYRFSNIDSSLLYTDVSIGYAEKLHLQDLLAQLLSLKGATVLEIGKIPESLQLQFEAMKISEELKDSRTKAYIVNRIGNAYMELGDYRKANEYYFLSMDLAQQNGDPIYFNELSNIGNIYELLNMPDSALYYQQIVLEAYSRYKGGTPAEMMFRLGNAYKQKGDTLKALEYYRKGIAKAKEMNDIRNLTMNNLFLAKLYREMNVPDSSLKYAYNALESGKSVSFRKGIYETSVLLSEMFNEKQKYDSAFKYLSGATVEKDSLTGTKRFRELQLILLNEKEQQRKNEAERVAVQNRQKQYALLAGLGIFLIIASILYRNNKQKQKTNKVLEKTLTHLKSTQSQLIQSEKMASLGELTAGIAHEIQNPLNFVNNFSEVNKELVDELQQELKAGKIDDAITISNDIRDNEEKINHHGKRADAIVKGMLQHSSSGSGKKEPTDINALADEYLRLAYHGLRAKDKSFNATMKTDFDQSIGSINIIPQDMGRVILNLINNAFFAVSERKTLLQAKGDSYEPTVVIATASIQPLQSLSKDGGRSIQIKVSDNGGGIPQKILDKIFQPFFTTKPTGQGTGLGLSLSYDIVKAHGGEIRVETKEGEGTVFLIQLPG